MPLCQGEALFVGLMVRASSGYPLQGKELVADRHYIDRPHTGLLEGGDLERLLVWSQCVA